jgi:hypothetical protein
MSRESKKSLSLNYSDFDIAGNVFRAWYDTDDKLIFVVDETIDEYKPNVLLVVRPDNDRKWDDILTNDYGLDLEYVRPKKDNKYQKLDIEYDGLDIYDALIRAYNNGKNIDRLLADLIDFRDAAVRRSATARLNSALEIIAQSNETIHRAEKSLSVLRERRRKLRNRLTNQKENIGREPTKQSAAKILRTESQLESNAGKLSRAELRIENANRRIDAANEDAAAARKLLARRRPEVKNDGNKHNEKHVTVKPIQQKTTKQQKAVSLPVPDYENQIQPQDEKMSDSEEVKPLFDKDPEILDEEIAFKPVEFDEIKSKEISAPPSKTDDDFNNAKSSEVARPLDFSQNDSEYRADEEYAETNEPETVLETITTVEESKPSDIDTMGVVDNTQYSNSNISRPVSPTPVAPVRPLSPISGNEPVRPVGEQHSRPTFAYYLLLILLIVLSVFTLWLYQKKNGGTMPVLNATSDAIVEPVQTEPVPVTEPVPTPESVTVEPEPDIPVVLPEPEQVVEPEPVPVVDTPIEVRYPNENVLRAAEPDVQVIESEEDVLARKNPYYVSRDDQVVYVPIEQEFVPEQPVRVTSVSSPSVIYDDDIVTVPVPAPEYDESEYYYEDTAAMYQPANNPYNQNEYNEYSGGFVGSDSYNEQYYDESGPETRRHLSVHDGGQYSISYDETIY